MSNQFSATRIADLGEDDRPREKALTHGINALTDSELLAIIFGGGLPGMSVIDMARNIMRDCDNSLFNLSKLTMHELKSKYKGVGDAKAVSLAAAFELGRRSVKQRNESEAPQIRHSSNVRDLMGEQLADLDYEEFWILTLSRANRVKYKHCISQGGTCATVVDVKLLLKRAIDVLADGLVLVHNHPSGNPTPSVEDDRLTQQIVEGAKILGIRVLDHVIIARGKTYSYADENRMPR